MLCIPAAHIMIFGFGIIRASMHFVFAFFCLHPVPAHRVFPSIYLDTHHTRGRQCLSWRDLTAIPLRLDAFYSNTLGVRRTHGMGATKRLLKKQKKIANLQKAG